MSYSLTTDSIKVLTWLQWSGSISEGKKMYWTGGILHNPDVRIFLENFFGSRLSYLEKTYHGIRNRKLYKTDVRLVRWAKSAGWRFGSGKRRAPEEIIDNAALFRVYLAAVIDSVGRLTYRDGDITFDCNLTLYIQHLEDLDQILCGLKKHELPSPRIVVPKTNPRSGYQIVWGRAGLFLLFGFIKWQSSRPRNIASMKYLCEDRDPIKRRFS